MSFTPGFLTSCKKMTNKADANKRIYGDIQIGIITKANNPEEDLKIVKDLGFRTCQIRIPDHNYSLELAKRVSDSFKYYNLIPSSLSSSGPGECKYNPLEGPSLCGLVPREDRNARVERLKQAIDFCKEAGVPDLISHFGFVPGNPKDTLYIEFIETMKDLTQYAFNQGINVLFETGTETPVTTFRVIQDVGAENLLVNVDTGNYLLYGNANPLDSLKVLGKYVRSLHAKDGNYPTDPYKLGKEDPIPEGGVDFPAIIEYLKEINFKGNIIIEYESPNKTNEYLLKTKKYLEELINKNTTE